MLHYNYLLFKRPRENVKYSGAQTCAHFQGYLSSLLTFP